MATDTNKTNLVTTIIRIENVRGAENCKHVI